LIQSDSGLVSATQLLTRFQEFLPALSEAIEKLVPEVTSITFSIDSSTSVFADVTLAPGVVASDQVYNQVVYELSHIFDVYPGTITWDTVATGKRQTPNRIVISFADEALPSDGFFLTPFLVALLPGLYLF